MNASNLGSRALRIATTPAEVVYALCAHWALIIFCIAAGFLGSWQYLRIRPLTFQGRAKLLVNPGETFVVLDPQTASPGQGRSSEEIQRFLITQSGILYSDSVLFKLAHSFSVQQEGDLTDEGDSWLKEIQKKFRDFIDSLPRKIGQEGSEAISSKQELAVSQFISSFLKQSQVVPNMRGNTIDIFIYGSNRDLLNRLMGLWIQSYMKHIEEIGRKSLEMFLRERIVEYETMEAVAMKNLEEFRDANPQVNKEEEEFLGQEIARIQIYRDDIRRESLEQQLGIGPIRPALPVVAPDRDPESQRRAFEIELLEARSKGYIEDSDLILKIKRKLQLLDEGKGAVHSEDRSKTENKSIQKALDQVTKELQDLVARRSEIKVKLEQRKILEDRYKSVADKKEKYTSMSQESLDMIESMKNVQIQIVDGPFVRTLPINKNPLLLMGLGLLGGLAMGVAVSLVWEVLSGKVRSIADVVCDLSIPVVAVIPKR